MGRLIDADKYMNRLQAEVNIEADIIAKYIKEDVPIGTVKDCGRIGRLQGIQWCKNVLELDCYTVEAIPKAEYGARLKADMVAMLEELKSEANELEDPKYILETSELPLDVDGTTLPLETYALQCYCRGGEDVIDIIEKKINELRGKIMANKKSNKPIFRGLTPHSSTQSAYCPKCGKIITHFNQEQCEHCGQKLDWRGV